MTDKKVDFGKQDKTDINGVVYEYFVKEIFENPGDVLNENWIVKEEGLTVTNTLRVKPENPEDPDKETDKFANLTVTKE